jgi:perosamine synthetase
LLLRALDVHKDDKVGVCAFTCLSVVEAVMAVGAVPIYLDIDEHLCINFNEILKYPRNYLKAVILQHTFGNPGKLDDLINACNDINAPIIEDCAHAIGCYWNKKHLGQFGEGAIFSFEWGKPYSTGQGGMLTVNSKELLNKIDELLNKYAVAQSNKVAVILETQRKIRSFLMATNVESRIRTIYKSFKYKNRISKTFSIDSWPKFESGYIKSPDTLTIREGLIQLKSYPEVVEHRRKNVIYLENLLKEKSLPIWDRNKSADITMLRYPVFVDNKVELLNIALRRGWDVGGWYNSPVHPLQDEDMSKVNYLQGSAVNSERLIKRLIHFPTNNITAEQLKEIINILFRR